MNKVDNTAPFTLHPNPDWHSAAQQLVNTLHSLDNPEDQICLLESLCSKLADQLYPAFLQTLHALEKFGDTDAKYLFSTVLSNCICSGRLPSGQFPSWGAVSITSKTAFRPIHKLGPIEYTCAWYVQGCLAGPLCSHSFLQIMPSLLRLISSNRHTKHHYCEKIINDINNPNFGQLSNKTKNSMLEMIHIWQITSNINDAADAFIFFHGSE